LVAAVKALVTNDLAVKDYPSRCERVENVIKAYNQVADDYAARGATRMPRYIFDRVSCNAKLSGTISGPAAPPSLPTDSCPTTGDLAYQSACGSCARLRDQIAQNERNGIIASMSRESFYNNCTAKNIRLSIQAPPVAAHLSAEDIRQCLSARIQLNDQRLPAATIAKIRGAYEAGYCSLADQRSLTPPTECDRYIAEWNNRANYIYKDQPGAMQRYEDALLQTLRTYRCPGFQ
jgi:hypothetical protein